MSILRVEIARAFLPLEAQPPRRYIAAWGGRGSTKSHYFGGRWLRRNVAGKTDVVCLREVQKSLEFSVKKLLEDLISRHNAGAYFEVQDKRILSTHGGVTIFEGMQNHTSDSIKSLEGFDIAWVEEAQSLSQTSLAILRPTIRKAGSQLWFSWNPNQRTDAVDEFFRGANPPKDAYIVAANWSDSPWLSAELESDRAHDFRSTQVGTEQQRKAAQAKYNWVWQGAYREAGDALVFTNWRVEEFDTPDGVHLRYGADWGFSIDPSVLVRCYLQGRRLYIDYEAYQIGCEIDRLPDLFMQVPECEKWPVVADSARPETISYMRNHGFPRMTAALKGAKSVEEGVAWLQSLEIVVHPRCRHAIEELSTYAYEVDKDTGRPIPILADKNNHVIDAVRYACEGARRAAKAAPLEIIIPGSSAAPYASR